ncbi:bola-like protein-domain-containing protein, partial [Cladochytrium replicatum]
MLRAVRSAGLPKGHLIWRSMASEAAPSASIDGPVTAAIKEKLTARFEPAVLQLRNDSSKHAHHQAMRGVSSQETHFAVTIVSDAFKGQNLVNRHKSVYEVLGEEFKAGLHALSITAKTTEEWSALEK